MRILIAAVVAIAAAGALLLVAGGSTTPTKVVDAVKPKPKAEEVDLDPAGIAQARRSAGANLDAGPSGHAQVVHAVRPGEASVEETQRPVSKRSSARAQTDAEIERDLDSFRKYLATIPPTTGRHAEVISSGEAAAPFTAPQPVIEVVQAANEIARTPYRWGGGHSAWRDKGYDCSGSISFALAAAGLLGGPLDSTRFMRYGAPGKGRWITIYANAGHAFMTVAGLRFDTSGLRTGTRWQSAMRPTGGFVARHPPGL